MMETLGLWHVKWGAVVEVTKLYVLHSKGDDDPHIRGKLNWRNQQKQPRAYISLRNAQMAVSNMAEDVEIVPYIPLKDLLKIADRLSLVLRGGEDYDGCWEELEQILGKYGYGIDSDGFVLPVEELV